MKSSRGINYQLEGKDGAPVLVFSNSLGTDLSMWQTQAEFFAPNFRVLRYDTRGHGLSALISENFSLADLGEDLLSLLNELNIPKAHYCGLSLGGFTGLWLGRHHPQRFYSLTLANTAPKIGTAESWESRISLVEKEGLEPIAASSAQRWFTPAFIQEHPAEVAKFTHNLTKTSPQVYIDCCKILRDSDLWSNLPEIPLSTLVIAGDKDPVTTVTEAQDMIKKIKHSQLVILPASHLSNLEGPGFSQALNHFIRQ